MSNFDLLKIALEIFLGFYSLFLIFLLVGIFRVRKEQHPNNLKASVIVPFRNEGQNLVKCISSLLDQNFEKDRFEIILVDDNSSDNSAELIKNFLTQPMIKLIRLDNDSGKKRAIEAGINLSNYEIIVTTDADCYHSKNWLSSLVQSFDDKTGFVAGKVVYSNTKNFFKELQKIEFASLVSIGAAFIGNKIPLLANGASCAYRKDLFFKVGGFKDNLSLASGDEEFLMQKIHFDTDYKVKFCSIDNCVAYTEPTSGLRKFINQRKRWVSKVPFYRNKLLLPILVTMYLFYFMNLASLFISLYHLQFAFFYFKIFILKNFIDLIFMLKGYFLLELSKDKTNLLKLLFLFPIAEFFHLLYISIVPILSYLTGFHWKGREFKR
ncbi:MAG: glycosyltransferase [Ignavibacteria bacterium]